LNDSYWRYRVEQGQASQPDRVEIERFTPEHDTRPVRDAASSSM
jgi:hypothetical protein